MIMDIIGFRAHNKSSSMYQFFPATFSYRILTVYFRPVMLEIISQVGPLLFNLVQQEHIVLHLASFSLYSVHLEHSITLLSEVNAQSVLVAVSVRYLGPPYLLLAVQVGRGASMARFDDDHSCPWYRLCLWSPRIRSSY